LEIDVLDAGMCGCHNEIIDNIPSKFTLMTAMPSEVLLLSAEEFKKLTPVSKYISC
jgi:hypothetical protein